MTQDFGHGGSPPTGTAPSDAELLLQHVHGDPDAFATLFCRHRDRLWAVALRTLSCPEEAADALQDAMISAYRGAVQFRGESAVTTWLHRVVVNACLDRLRRRAGRYTEPLPDHDHAELGGPAAVSPLSLLSPVDAAETQEVRVDIMRALRTLGDDQRAAIVLVDMEGYSVEEAAALLGCAPGTIKSRCARGRARLAPLLAHLNAPPAGRGNRGDVSDVPGVLSRTGGTP